MNWFEILMLVFIILLVGGFAAWRIAKFVLNKKRGVKTTGCSSCSACSARGGCPHANATVGADDEKMPEINVQSEVKCDFSDLVEKKVEHNK